MISELLNQLMKKKIIELKKMEKLNKFEKSRLLGARALELSRGAKPKIDIEKEKISILLSRDLIKIAQLEYERGLLELKVIKN